MSLPRSSAIRDLNEKTLVEYLRKSGYIVTRLSGAGVPDLLCVKPNPSALYIARDLSDITSIVAEQHEVVLIEVKNGKNGLTTSQQQWWAKVGKI